MFGDQWLQVAEELPGGIQMGSYSSSDSYAAAPSPVKWMLDE